MATPHITSLSPNQSHSGVTLTITGTGLLGATKVTFGTTSVTPTGSTATTVTVAIPFLCCGQTPVTVTVGSLTSNSVPFYYICPPGCGPINPAVGPAGTATALTIFGSSLLTTSAVAFGTLGAGTGVTPVSDTQLTVTTPTPTFTGSTSTVDVIVTTSGGANPPGGAIGQYTFYNTPTVSGVSPTTGVAASTTTVTGTNLVDVSVVSFVPPTGPAVPALGFSSISGTQLNVVVPTLTAGTVYDIQATNPGGTSAINAPGDQFTG